MQYATISEALNCVRGEKKHAREYAAALMQVTARTLRRWESGITRPHVEHMAPIAMYTGLTLVEVYRLIENQFNGAPDAP